MVSVEVESLDGSCIVSISDKGAGIPKEYINRLGREKITFKGGSGRGTGLTHAMEFIEANRGEIKILSEVGVGSKISITLPRFKDEEPTKVVLNCDKL